MMKSLCGLSALLIVLAASGPSAQDKQTTTIRVSESSGIRRTEYPVHARVQIPQRLLADATHAQLRLNDMPVPAQYTVAGKWPDGSAQALDVDFNVTLTPGEARTYQLDYGAAVTTTTAPRGLAVTEDGDTIQIGTAKFSRRGAPLFLSANFVRSEFIGQFPDALNGFAIVEATGTRHDLAGAQPLTAELLKRGPLSVVLQYTGRMPFDAAYATPFVVTIEMPNSKSWVKMSASVTDPGRRVRELAFDTPLALGAFPLLWDFGTENGTYGVFRTANDATVFTQVVPPGAVNWKVDTGTRGDVKPYETAVATPAATGRARTAAGYGHLQGPTQAVAFAIDGLGDTPGTYTISLDGRGQASYRYSAPAGGAPVHRFAIYQHFVSTPVAIGAATTPVSMLHPPTVAVQ